MERKCFVFFLLQLIIEFYYRSERFVMLCRFFHYILFGTWVTADDVNIWNDNSGDNALSYWTIKNIEAQHTLLLLEMRWIEGIRGGWVWLQIALKGVDYFILKKCEFTTFTSVLSNFTVCRVCFQVLMTRTPVYVEKVV